MKTIEAKIVDGEPVWQPDNISASVGDEVEWKLTSGRHGVRITNWAAVKDHVEVETVQGQQPFNATTGENDHSTNTVGQVLLRLKIESVPPAPGSITFECIVHGSMMSGEVSVVAANPGA
jgi:plastocyanin